MIGLLWFDDDPNRDLRQKVGNAARRYTEKFGRLPTVCYVHPSALNGLGSSDNSASGISLDIGGVPLRVEARRSVLPYHFFVGDGNEEYRSDNQLSDSISDKGRDILDTTDSGTRRMQPALFVLDDVPGRREAGQPNSV